MQKEKYEEKAKINSNLEKVQLVCIIQKGNGGVKEIHSKN